MWKYGVIPPALTFSVLEKITRSHGTLLIFDEVITGFRVALGGAQELYELARPTCLGKILGGGLPWRFWRQPEIMDCLLPRAGLPSWDAFGNPLAVAAG
jgi:glutamate-1-semialdehyde 2,1-aminomutase